MTTVDSWLVESSPHEEDGNTRAEARLARDAGGRERDLRPPDRYGDSRSMIQPSPPWR